LINVNFIESVAERCHVVERECHIDCAVLCNVILTHIGVNFVAEHGKEERQEQESDNINPHVVILELATHRSMFAIHDAGI
jgi:hypothetical protein